MITLDTVLRLRREVRFRVVGRESIAVRQDSAEVMAINEVGGRMLELLDGERSLSVLVDQLLGEYDVERDRLETDVCRFAAEMIDAGLIEAA